MALATRPPVELGQPITHWSLADLTRACRQEGVVSALSPSTVWRLLDQAALKPHRWHYWLHSPDPNFQAKMLEVVNLYLQAPDLSRKGEIVLSVDEKTSIQALERQHPSSPPGSGRPARIEYEYIRHGTCCLTAGFEVATGSVMGMLTANRPAEVFAAFVEWVGAYYHEARRIHVVLDNLNTHYHALTCQAVAKLCRRKPPDLTTQSQRVAYLTPPDKRVVFHFTPSHASWLNQIEIWFSTLTRKVIRRGDFSSVADLEDKIIAFIRYYNKCLAHPYQWTYTGKPLAGLKEVA